MSMVLVSLMEIKGFWQCVAANKQQWCGFVAAASCGLVAACAFFVCKLVSWVSVSATLRNLAADSHSNLAVHCLRLVRGSLCAESV